VQSDLDGHDLAEAELGISLTVFVTIAEQLFVPQGFKKSAEIIHTAEKFF
jgi:hypothetical protein